MREIGPEHPLTYRRKEVSWIYRRIAEHESCVLVSVPQMGLTRLLDFVMRPDVQQHYLPGGQPALLLLHVDSNRREQTGRWGLCELMLASLIEGSHSHPSAAGLYPELKALHREILTTQNTVLAYRNLEMAVNMLVGESGIEIYFLISEFDELYKNLSELELSGFRSIRNAYKYRVNYGLCLQDFPDRLRKDSKDLLTALISHDTLALGPYTDADAETMLRQLEYRKKKELTASLRRSIFSLSGGHPGLISAIFDSLDFEAHPLPRALSPETLFNQPLVLQVCRRLWDSLGEDEKNGLLQVAQDASLEPRSQALELLQKKHLVYPSGGERLVFSPVFTSYIRKGLTAEPKRLRLLPETYQVQIGSIPAVELSDREFHLVSLLFEHKNQVVNKDAVRDHVYGGEDVSDEAIANLVRQVRNKIEPVKGHPQYIRNSHGKGYLLVDNPQEEGSPSRNEADA